MSRTIPLLMMLAAAAAAQNANPNATNAANRIPAGLPGHGVAPNSLFVVLGKDLPSLPALGVSLNGAAFEAPVVEAKPDRLVAQLPPDVPAGNGQVQVGAQRVPIVVVREAYGIFTRNGLGNGPARARHYDSQRAVTAMEPARSGFPVVLAGTGAGAQADSPIEVLVAGRKVGDVGLSRLDNGEDELTFNVPEGVLGCAVNVTVKIGKVYSNDATLPVSADGGPCVAEAGPGAAELEEWRARGNVRSGSITLSRYAMQAQGMSMVTDAGSAIFQRSASELGEAAWQMPAGQCLVMTSSSVDGEFAAEPEQLLDAGPALELRGPKGVRQLKKEEGIYAADLGTQMDLPAGTPPFPGFSGELFLDPGEYIVTGPGGQDVGPFTAKLKLGARLDWTNRSRFARVSRAEDQRVEWSGGSPGDVVMILGSAAQGKSQAAFVCTERVERGAFTVPASVLSRLPASNRAAMMLQTAPSASSRFTAPGLDLGWIAGFAGVMQTVAFQ